MVVGLGVAIAGSHPVAGGVVGALLAVAGLQRRSVVMGCLAVVPVGVAVGVPWPVPALVAFGASWWLLGRRAVLDRPAGVGAVRTVIVTIGLTGLCAGLAVLVADISVVTPMVVYIDAPPLPLLIAGVLLVAAVNSAGEELLWRSMLHDWLAGSTNASTGATVVTTAASFGLAHLAGLPGGVIGVVTAGLMGVALGVARTRIGLLPCIIVHFAVDVTIFSSVAASAVWVGSQAA